MAKAEAICRHGNGEAVIDLFNLRSLASVKTPSQRLTPYFACSYVIGSSVFLMSSGDDVTI
jgi:hypothetical protein